MFSNFAVLVALATCLCLTSEALEPLVQDFCKSLGKPASIRCLTEHVFTQQFPAESVCYGTYGCKYYCDVRPGDCGTNVQCELTEVTRLAVCQHFDPAGDCDADKVWADKAGSYDYFCYDRKGCLLQNLICDLDPIGKVIEDIDMPRENPVQGDQIVFAEDRWAKFVDPLVESAVCHGSTIDNSPASS